MSLTRESSGYTVLSESTIAINGNFSESVLRGRQVDGVVPIEVTPSKDKDSIGVLARLRVRRDWVDIVDVDGSQLSQRLRRSLNELMNRSGGKSERLDLFRLLLAHLVLAGLQNDGDGRDATLAASALVLVPSESVANVSVASAREVIKIAPNAVSDFLKSYPGEERAVLAKHGIVSSDEGSDLPNSYAHNALSLLLSHELFTEILPFVDEARLAVFSEAFTNSTGVRVEIARDGFEVRVKFGGPVREPMSTTEIFTDLLADDYVVLDMISQSNVRTFGGDAIAMARLSGFEYGYHAMQRRIQPYSYSWKGRNFISYRQLFEAVRRPNLFENLSGVIVRFNIES